MKRRALLGTLATLAAAGCTESPGRSVPSTTTQSTTADTQPATTTETTGATAGDATTPTELLNLGAAASEVDCPVPEQGRAVCYPEHAGAAISLTPDPETVELPAGETTLALANDTNHEYRANFYGWQLSKRVDGEWFRVAPQFYPEPLHSLPAGDTHEWTLLVDNSEEPTGGAATEEDIELAGLGGGEYAFAVTGWFPLEDGEGDGSETFDVAVAARFELDGDPIELTPSGDLDTSREDGTVTVTSSHEPNEDEPLSVLTVERVGEEGVPPERQIHERIAEQLLRPGMGVMGDPNPLRNAVPFFEDGVETVRYEAPSGVTPPFGVDEPRFVRYDGEVYEITSERVD